MKSFLYSVSLSFFLFSACSTSTSGEEMGKWKAEVKAAEKAFNDMAQTEGLAKAFAHFAAEEGVIKRRNKIIKGKVDIGRWYEADTKPGESLSWEPTYIEVSKSGDLAYTYGDFIFSSPDSLGNIQSNTGIFHTVWKRQSDGSWKFVWD
ncbi:MAG: hypothetical protein R8P61_24685 [Bacteroidia bacterium]|nr:hypothetical protein [Bacteroidia bacterium]